MMQLKVLLPTEVLMDLTAAKVIAEAANGSFCLLPRHIDFVAALVPGILQVEDAEGQEEFVAVDEGLLVKRGWDVLVSTRHGVRGKELGTLQRALVGRFEALDERERAMRSTLARLEADFARRFLELERHDHA